MVRFTIFGIPVLIHPFFWLTLVIIGGYGADTPQEILRAGLFVVAGFISLLVHELGHALTARKFGAQVEIVLQAFGGYAAYSGVRLNRLQQFAITAAGPAVQILLGLTAWVMLQRLPQVTPNTTYLLWILVTISIFWALLNLLPILPLDGGRMLEAILGPARIRTTLTITIITAAIMGVLVYQYFGSIIFPIFLGMFAWQAWQRLRSGV